MVVPPRIVSCVLVGALIAAAASAGSPGVDNLQPLRFFEGRTEMISVVRVVMKKPYQSHTMGRGELLSDGSLALVQVIEEDGRPPSRRTWMIHQIDAERYEGTMSDAVGPVRIQRMGGAYRFKFKMKGNLAVEQWLTPTAGGKSARSRMTARKFGIRVATSEGTIRKL
jgi:hypothetical protein